METELVKQYLKDSYFESMELVKAEAIEFAEIKKHTILISGIITLKHNDDLIELVIASDFENKVYGFAKEKCYVENREPISGFDENREPISGFELRQMMGC
jgi:hypothetical protein